jgi:hypothetical protein
LIRTGMEDLVILGRDARANIQSVAFNGDALFCE